MERILQAVEKQPVGQRLQQYRYLLQCWDKVVSPRVAAHTRPLYISRQVLSVATSNSVWAQTLTMQRHQLLQKLNALLPEREVPLSAPRSGSLTDRLTDIRFSPTLQSRTGSSSRTDHSQSSLQNHPSWVEGAVPLHKLKNHEAEPQVEKEPASNSAQEVDDPQAALPQAQGSNFQLWMDTIKKRTLSLPLCPNCSAPTPAGELQRWQICCYCAARKWSNN